MESIGNPTYTDDELIVKSKFAMVHMYSLLLAKPTPYPYLCYKPRNGRLILMVS